MAFKLNQKGFGHLAMVMFVLAFAVIGFAGYKVLMAQTPPKPATPANSNASTVATGTTVPATINSQADLHAAANALDNTNAQLDSSFDTSAIDSDINSML